jgi:hypothetical protein
LLEIPSQLKFYSQKYADQSSKQDQWENEDGDLFGQQRQSGESASWIK